MPSGEAHAAITTAAAGLIYLWAIKSGEPLDLAAAAAVGCAAGVLVNPDLDLVGTRADHLIRREGFLISVIWGILWYPYSALIPHRSIISHGLILGTAIRIIYIGLAALLVIGARIRPPGPYMVRIWTGLLVSDNLHIGADFLLTGVKHIIYVRKNNN